MSDVASSNQTGALNTMVDQANMGWIDNMMQNSLALLGNFTNYFSTMRQLEQNEIGQEKMWDIWGSMGEGGDSGGGGGLF